MRPRVARGFHRSIGIAVLQRPQILRSLKGEKPQLLNPGDTVNIPPDRMHWHGASPDRLFSHLGLSEAGEQGQGTAWGTHVSDAEYNEAASGG